MKLSFYLALIIVFAALSAKFITITMRAHVHNDLLWLNGHEDRKAGVYESTPALAYLIVNVALAEPL